jgi:hypothetical protein
MNRHTGMSVPEIKLALRRNKQFVGHFPGILPIFFIEPPGMQKYPDTKKLTINTKPIIPIQKFSFTSKREDCSGFV